MLTIYRRFFRYLLPYVYQEILLLIFIAISSCGALASPYILKILIDKVFPNRDAALLIKTLLILLGIYLLRILSSVAADYLHTWISNRIVRDIRKSIFKHILHLEISYFKQNKTADLLYKINNEVDKIRQILTSVIVRILDNIFTMAGIIVLLASLNLKLFLYSIILFPLIFASVKYFTPRIKRAFEETGKKESDLLHYFTERFSSIKIIKVFNTYRWETDFLDTKIAALMKLNQHTSLLSSTNRNISSFLMAAGPVIVLWIGGSDLIAGTVTLGSLIAFIQYLNRLYPPSLDLLNLYGDIIRATVSMKNVMKIFDEPVCKRTTSMTPFELNFNRIEFVNVSLSYDEKPVLKNLNCSFQCGKVYAIVGASGCGKSSMINLLCRFLDPDQGVIKVDNIDISEIDKYTWLETVSLMAQDYNIFNASIRDNIVYGTFDIDDVALGKFLQYTGVDSIAQNLKNGLHTEAGERGTRFSGGEVQRILITRALLKRARILILDEATSAIDSKTEENILLNLRLHFNIPLIFIISHRVSTIRHADEVVCLENGMIIEKGSPAALLKKKGAYYNLFKAQLNHADNDSSAIGIKQL